MVCLTSKQCAENGMQDGTFKWRVVRQVVLNCISQENLQSSVRSNLHSKPPATKWFEKWRAARQVVE